LARNTEALSWNKLHEVHEVQYGDSMSSGIIFAVSHSKMNKNGE